jgi:aryl-alcohol dehydrogenase-like predicted oxidoreductase
MLAAGHYSLAEARASLDTSLRELGTDTVDLLLVHECTRAAPVRGDVIAWLRDLRAQGKIRAWGFATGGDEADHYRAGYPHADAVLQRELRPHDLAEPAAGVICHSPFALLPGVAASSGLARRRLETFALTHDLRAADLPLLLLEAALHASPDCVILCSMFQPRHLQANTQCLARPRFAPALRAEFMRLVMEMQGLEDAINGHRPDRTLQTMEQSQ